MTVSVRYIVDDVQAAIEFYRDCLGFHVETASGPGFAMLCSGELRLLLNVPDGGGGAGQAMPDGPCRPPGVGTASSLPWTISPRRSSG